ncbi:protein IRX15-LIKE-like [Typha latifolia]|uniref:protein IRX15-LIKE-like n=1 Tax=Typha latifolia TaxID=4733 RepID=UPI003C2AB7A9
MKGVNSAKLILFHHPSSPQKPHPLLSNHRILLILFVSFFTFASLLTLLSTTTSFSSSSKIPPTSFSTASSSSAPLSSHVFDALLHYAANSNLTGLMKRADLLAIAAVLRRRVPCNLLVFGLGDETPLWRALNSGGRTVFLDENEYYVSHIESLNPGIESYDVAYTTHVRDLADLLAAARDSRAADCRPFQNLLFSDCRLALNDLPNHIYDVAWDVILVDGPRGYASAAPGRMAAIYSASVMARYRGQGPTDVLVHDYNREVERVCSEEFLCKENRVAVVNATEKLAHYVIPGGAAARRDVFCVNSTGTAAS